MTTLAYYRGMLRTNKHRLDEELEQQADIQDRIAQEVSVRERKADESADELKQCEARLTADAYRDNVERGRKMTVDQVAGEVRRHRDRVAAFDRNQDAQADLREWQNLLDAWKVKGFTLRDLGALYGSDYFSLTQTSVSAGGPSERDMRRMLRDASEAAAPVRRKVVVR